MQETLLEGNLKIERAVEGLRRQAVRRLSEHAHKPNGLSKANFLLACRVESNISGSYREDLIFTELKAVGLVDEKQEQEGSEHSYKITQSGRALLYC